MESYEQLLDFVKRSNAVSPTVAMETATALQVCCWFLELLMSQIMLANGLLFYCVLWPDEARAGDSKSPRTNSNGA